MMSKLGMCGDLVAFGHEFLASGLFGIEVLATQRMDDE
jgi:hypothetical protein